MVSGQKTERFHFFFIFEFFSLINPLPLFVVWSPPLSSNFLWMYIFFRENDRKSVYRKKKMMREEDEERGGALDPLLLSEEVDSEEEDKEEKGEIDDYEA
jgi:hypothetical protein